MRSASIATVDENEKEEKSGNWSDDSFGTDSSSDSILNGSSDDDLTAEDKALQNQILQNFAATYKKGYSTAH